MVLSALVKNCLSLANDQKKAGIWELKEAKVHLPKCLRTIKSLNDPTPCTHVKAGYHGRIRLTTACSHEPWQPLPAPDHCQCYSTANPWDWKHLKLSTSLCVYFMIRASISSALHPVPLIYCCGICSLPCHIVTDLGRLRTVATPGFTKDWLKNSHLVPVHSCLFSWMLNICRNNILWPLNFL